MSYFKPGFRTLTQMDTGGGTITTVSVSYTVPGSMPNRAARVVNPSAAYQIYANSGTSAVTATVTDMSILPNDFAVIPVPHNATTLAMTASGTITGVTWCFGTIEP